MAIKNKYINESVGIILLVLLGSISLSSAVIDCGGKAFHCVNTTHFMICVDFGGGLSTTVNEYIVPCPPATECRNNNYFECEYPAPTTPAAIVVSSDVTNEVPSNISSSASTLPWEEIITTNLSQAKTSEKTTLNTVSSTTLAGASVTTEVIPIVSDRDLTNHSVSDIKLLGSNNTLDIHKPNDDIKITTESDALPLSTTSLNLTETGDITLTTMGTENATNTSLYLVEHRNVNTDTIITTESPTEQVTIYSNLKYTLSEIAKEMSPLNENHRINIDNNELLSDPNTQFSERNLPSKTSTTTEYVTLPSNDIKDISTVTNFNNNVADFTSETKEVEVVYSTLSSLLLPEKTTSQYDAYVSTENSLKETVTTNPEGVIVSSNIKRVGDLQDILINSTSYIEGDRLLSTTNDLNISAALAKTGKSISKISNDTIADPLGNTLITNVTTGNPISTAIYTENITPHPKDQSVVTSAINIDLNYELFNYESTQTEDYSISTVAPETVSTTKQLDEFPTTIYINEDNITVNKSLETENSELLYNENSTIILDVVTTVNPLDDILSNTVTQNGDDSLTTIFNSNSIVEYTSTGFIQRENSSLTTILDITKVSSHPENVESNKFEQSEGMSPTETTNQISNADADLKTGQFLLINSPVAESTFKPVRSSTIQLNGTTTEETSTTVPNLGLITKSPRETKELSSTTIIDVEINNSKFKILNKPLHIEELPSARPTANSISNLSNNASIPLDIDKEYHYAENTELNKSKQTEVPSTTLLYVENTADSIKNKTLNIDPSSSLLRSSTTVKPIEKRLQTNRPIQNSKYSTINVFDTETTTNSLVKEILNETLSPEQLPSTQIYSINTNQLNLTTNPTEAEILDGPTHTEELFLTTLTDVVTTIKPSEYEIVNKTLTLEQQSSTRLNPRTTNLLGNIASDSSTQVEESSTTLYVDKPPIFLKNTKLNEPKEKENNTGTALDAIRASNYTEGEIFNVPMQELSLTTVIDVVSTTNTLESEISNKTKNLEQLSPSRLNSNTTSNPSENILFNNSIQRELNNLPENIELDKFKSIQNSSTTVLDGNPTSNPIEDGILDGITHIKEFSLTTLIDTETTTNPIQSQILNNASNIEELPFTRLNSSKTTNPFENNLLNETTQTEETPLKTTLKTDSIVHALENTEVNEFNQNESSSTTILDIESTTNVYDPIGSSNFEILDGPIQIEELSTINPLKTIVSDKSTQVEEPSTTIMYTDKAFNLLTNTELNKLKQMEKSTATTSDVNSISSPIKGGTKPIEDFYLTTFMDVKTTPNPLNNENLNNTSLHFQQPSLIRLKPNGTSDSFNILLDETQKEKFSTTILDVDSSSIPLENEVSNKTLQYEQPSSIILNFNTTSNPLENNILLNRATQIEESSLTTTLEVGPVFNVLDNEILNKTSQVNKSSTVVNEVENKILATEQTSSTRLYLSNPKPLGSIVSKSTTQITDSLTTILPMDNEPNLLNDTEFNELKQFKNFTATVLDANTTSNPIEAEIFDGPTQRQELSLTTITYVHNTINQSENKISNKRLLYLEQPLLTTQTQTTKTSVLLDVKTSFDPLGNETVNLNATNNPLENILLNKSAQNEETSLTTTLDLGPSFISLETEILKKPTQVDEFSTRIVNTKTTINPLENIVLNTSTQIEESLTTRLYTDNTSNVIKNPDTNNPKEIDILTSTILGVNQTSNPIQIGILAKSTQIEGFLLSTPIYMDTTNPLGDEIINKTSKQPPSIRFNVNMTSDRLDNIPIKGLTQTEESLLTTTQDPNKVFIFPEKTEFDKMKQVGDSSITALDVNLNFTETEELLNRPTQIKEYSIPENKTFNMPLYTEELNSTLMPLSKSSASTTKFITEITTSSLPRQNSSIHEARLIEEANFSKNDTINFSESTLSDKQIESDILSSGKIFDVKPANNSLENAQDKSPLVQKYPTLIFNLETTTEAISFKIPTPSYGPQQTVVSTYSTYIEVPPATTSPTRNSLSASILTTSLGINYMQSSYPESSTTSLNELATTTKSESVDKIINEESKNNNKISNVVIADLFDSDKLQFDIKNKSYAENKNLDENNKNITNESRSLHTNDTFSVNMANNNVTIVNTSSLYARNPVTLPTTESTTLSIDDLVGKTDAPTKQHTHEAVHTERTQTLRNQTIKSRTPFVVDDRNNKSNNGGYNLQNNEKFIYQQFNCLHRSRGKYGDKYDCKKFYICIGRRKPIIGICPNNTVYSDLRKQCTKNLSHCIRENRFQCASIGKFTDFLNENVYYICLRNAHGAFVRFKFQCQRGYRLNKDTVKCIQNSGEIIRSVSYSSRQDSEKTIEKDSKEERSNSKQNIFECEKEGKFFDPTDCRRYYVCTKNRKSTFRRRRKKCHSDEIFHKDKKKCVDNESHECGSTSM